MPIVGGGVGGLVCGTSGFIPLSKEGVLLRNVSASLVLSDHLPGGGILELGNRSGKE